MHFVSLLTILTKWPHLTISTQPSIYIPHISLQCLQFPSHVVSQTSTIQFLFPLTEQLISFPFTSQLSCPSSPNVSPAFLHSFAFPPISGPWLSPTTSCLSLSAQMIPTSVVSWAVIGPQHCSSRPFQPIQPLLSHAGRRRCLQIPMRDSFSHLLVTSCDAFRRGLWRPLTRSAGLFWPQVAAGRPLLLLLGRWRTSKPELEIKGAASNAIHGGWREGGGGLDGRDIGRCQCLIRSVGAKCCCIFIH